ncbi:DNA primase large subunit [Thelohanellus kitauei]|uniref:DNA primase large subunit n=1 Tax=Thelohanellus kitauei TaxID=669202 RepID=A0A0C2MS83_THEKT|nr:DNA primase large subunit [Thelohanellus kitauei]
MKPLFETTRNVRQVINQSLNLYLDPPRDNIQLVELENLANDRRICKACLELVLGKVEALTLKLQKNSAKYESGLANAIREYDNALQVNCIVHLARFGSDIRKYDCIAHFMVRLALSKMIDRKNWYRLGRESVETIQKLLKSTQIKYQFLNIPNENDDKNNRKCYFKLDFELVPDLVRTRQVDLRNGFAYLTVENLRPLILQYFKSELSKRMDILSKNMVMMEEDERLMSSLKKILYS